MVYKLNEGEKLINSYRAHELTLLPTVLEVFVLIFVLGFLRFVMTFSMARRAICNFLWFGL